MSEFVVEDVFFIRGRGPTITRSDEASYAARDRGERFHLGETVRCGELEATIVGIERWAIPNAPDGALLLRGVELDQLEVGQVWMTDR